MTTTPRTKASYAGRGLDRRVAVQAHVLDFYPAPAALFDEGGTLIYINRNGGHDGWLARLSIGAHLGKLANGRGDDAQLQSTRAGIADVIAGVRDHFELDYAMHTGGGDRWYRLVVTPTAEFAPRGALVLHHDLTETKRTEERLRASQEHLDLAMWGTGLGLWSWDLQTGQFNVGSRWLEMLGYRRDDLEPRAERMHGLVHPGDRERRRKALQAHLAGSAPFYESEHRLQTKGGEWLWVLDRGMVVERDDSGRGRRVNGITLDLTDKKTLAARLNQANKMEAIGRLAGGVAHDFNNLLTAINGYSDLALNGLAEEDPIAAHLRAIKRSGDRAASLNSRLLAFSRRQILQPRVLDLNRVVRNIRKLLQPVIGEDIKVVQQLDLSLRPVKADLGQMEQVIKNLAVNARDPMRYGGTLTLRTGNVEMDSRDAAALPGFRPGSYVLLSVSDTGTGMDEKVKARVFEPFFTTKPKGQGTGLGLSMVYGIVKQSDGYTEIDSAPGRGTTVNVYLPPVDISAAAADIAEEDTTEAEVEVPEGTETVLLVEDEGAVRQLMRAVLRERGYDVLEAGSAEEAIELFEESPRTVDLLVTDVVLPGLNGDELVRSLRQRMGKLRALLISGYPRGSIGMQHKLPPDPHFLQQPFSPSVLCRRVRELLDEGGEGAGGAGGGEKVQ